MVFFPKVLWFCCGVQFLGDLRYKHRPAHVDLITQLSSNNLCSTVTHIVHHKTCAVIQHISMLSLTSCSSQEWQLRESVVGLIKKKNAFFASSIAHVAVELVSIFASGKHRESGFTRAWQDEFPFTTEYVKIRL